MTTLRASATVAAIVAAIVAVFLCSSCQKVAALVERAIQTAAETNSTPTLPEAPIPLPSPSGNATTPPAAWASIDAPRFMDHNYEGEDAYRRAALAEAKGKGIPAIRCNFNFGATDELLIHLTCLEHPTQRNYMNERDNWFFIAEREANVRQWIYDAGTLTAAKVARLLYVFRHRIATDRVRFAVAADSPPDLVAQLRANTLALPVIVNP